jgi:hypothetical protein
MHEPGVATSNDEAIHHATIGKLTKQSIFSRAVYGIFSSFCACALASLPIFFARQLHLYPFSSVPHRSHLQRATLN